MEDKIIKFLYYISWAVGIFVAGVLIYGIVESLGRVL